MKKLLLTLFAFAALAPAAPVQRYILELDNNPYDVAGDYTVSQSGPQPYADWVSSGVVSWVVAWRESGGIRAFSFNPCPAFGVCAPRNYTVFAAPAWDPAPFVSAAAPEPRTLFLAFGAVAIAFGRKRRTRGVA